MHLQFVERGGEIGAGEQHMAVERPRCSPGRFWRVTRSGDSPYSVAPGMSETARIFSRSFADRPQHLELELRDPVAVVAERKRSNTT